MKMSGIQKVEKGWGSWSYLLQCRLQFPDMLILCLLIILLLVQNLQINMSRWQQNGKLHLDLDFCLLHLLPQGVPLCLHTLLILVIFINHKLTSITSASPCISRPVVKTFHWLGPSPSGAAPATTVSHDIEQSYFRIWLLRHWENWPTITINVQSASGGASATHQLTWGDLYTKVLIRNPQARSKNNMMETQ